MENSKLHLKWAIINNKEFTDDLLNSFNFYYERRIVSKNNEQIFFIKPEHALVYCIEQGYSYCLINWQGLLINDHPAYYKSVVQHIDRMNDAGEWLVSGQIIDDESSYNFWNPGQQAVPYTKWYYLWPITCIVNVKKWEELGRPDFGALGKHNIVNLPRVKRSENNIHDNYTPLYIDKLDEPYDIEKSWIDVKHAWNLIKVSLENNLRIDNIPASMRSYTEYTYPENDIVSYVKTMEFIQMSNSTNLNFKLIKLMNDLGHRMTNTAFNAFNSEGLSPANDIELYYNSYPTIDTIVYPVQGFKDFLYSFSNVCTNQHPVNIIHYDLTLDVVNKRKHFIENWDCTLEYIINNRLVNANEENYKDSWDELLSYFHDYDHMVAQWNKYKKCKHYYVEQNLMNEIYDKRLKRLLDSINSKNVLFMYSDIFPWESNVLIRGINNLNELERKLVNHIKEGRDYLLTESKGITRHVPQFIEI